MSAHLRAAWAQRLGRQVTAASFTPSLVSTWEQTKPWNASRQDLEWQMVPGIFLGKQRGSESAYYDSKGRIYVTEEWLSHPEGTRKAILYHEAGHGLGVTVGLVRAADYFGVENGLDIQALPGADRFGYNPDEVIAEAYSILWMNELAWADSFEGGRFILDAVTKMARDAGFPLPRG